MRYLRKLTIFKRKNPGNKSSYSHLDNEEFEKVEGPVEIHLQFTKETLYQKINGEFFHNTLSELLEKLRVQIAGFTALGVTYEDWGRSYKLCFASSENPLYLVLKNVDEKDGGIIKKGLLDLLKNSVDLDQIQLQFAP